MRPSFAGPRSPMRRRLIQAAALAACLPLAACAPPPEVGGTFVQLWRSHLDWTRSQWRERLTATHALGCKEIFVQWAGIDGEPANTWMAPDSLIQTLLDESAALGMGVHLGVPYDERWWKVIGNKNDAALDAFLQRTGERSASYMQSALWTLHDAFRGWYVPYELEQYNWADPVRIDKLANWLDSFSDIAIATSGQPPTVSTYFSQLPTTGTLAGLWSVLLDRVKLHPMIQDGVGVAGIGNYDALRPLHDMLVARNAKFDLILELFEQLPTKKNDGTEFNARSASFRRIEAQWDIARAYGAQRIVAFSLDPWVLGDSDDAKSLLKRWQSAMASAPK
ncbi:Tat pathway signal protein [Pandoraea horticolens]|uniref:Tat pathway signal protein n=2 Tax=Pandoraea horticolens TaxID=2508298 RepID=A0A5E4VXX9_9BURK|nr:Tat pathway signal protein [Pandoraea horticolens]